MMGLPSPPSLTRTSAARTPRVSRPFRLLTCVAISLSLRGGNDAVAPVVRRRVALRRLDLHGWVPLGLETLAGGEERIPRLHDLPGERLAVRARRRPRHRPAERPHAGGDVERLGEGVPRPPGFPGPELVSAARLPLVKPLDDR